MDRDFIKDFPKPLKQCILQRQEEQGLKPCLDCYKKEKGGNRREGFSWIKTPEGAYIWNRLFNYCDFIPWNTFQIKQNEDKVQLLRDKVFSLWRPYSDTIVGKVVIDICDSFLDETWVLQSYQKVPSGTVVNILRVSVPNNFKPKEQLGALYNSYKELFETFMENPFVYKDLTGSQNYYNNTLIKKYGDFCFHQPAITASPSPNWISCPHCKGLGVELTQHGDDFSIQECSVCGGKKILSIEKT